MIPRYCICTLLFFLVFIENDTAWANLTLKVNYKSTAYNTINYTDSAGAAKSMALSWKEKAQYDTATGLGQIKPCITITNAAVGDLIVKLDVLIGVTNGTDNIMEVRSYWLKYANIPSPLGYIVKEIEMVENGHAATGTSDIVDKNNLSTLCLLKQVPKSEVITLMDFISERFPLPAHLIFTAILIDDVDVAKQVIGVDIQNVYFGREWKALVQYGN
jgi:hypothetical protein